MLFVVRKSKKPLPSGLDADPYPELRATSGATAPPRARPRVDGWDSETEEEEEEKEEEAVSQAAVPVPARAVRGESDKARKARRNVQPQ